MKDIIKNNFAIILAFALPIVVIVIVSLSTYLPSLFIKTDYDFIYASCNFETNYYNNLCNKYLQQRFSVENNKLIVNEVDLSEDTDDEKFPERPPEVDLDYTARIFLHDTEKNESREITLEEAQKFTLSGLLTSPDGITVSSHYDRGADYFFIFDGGSSYGYYLTKGRSKSKINLINQSDRYYYRDNFRFIGWTLSQ